MATTVFYITYPIIVIDNMSGLLDGLKYGILLNLGVVVLLPIATRLLGQMGSLGGGGGIQRTAGGGGRPYGYDYDYEYGGGDW